MHKRKAIKDAVLTALTGLTTTGANVFPSRVHATPDKVLPALLVYWDDEESEPGSIGEVRELDRIASLVIDGRAKAGATIDDDLETIAEEIEVAMDVDRMFGGLCLESYLAGTTFSLSGEGRRRAGSVKLTYNISYSY